MSTSPVNSLTASPSTARPAATEPDLPRGYAVLNNAHLMEPVDLINWPMRIDHARQLLIDDHLVGLRRGLTRQFHAARPHPGNPLMSADQPWEPESTLMVRSVLRDERGGFRMWYMSLLDGELPNGEKAKQPCLYAESDDGLTWRKPNLGLLEYEGSRENNIVRYTAFCGIMHDPAAEPDKRFVAVGFDPSLAERRAAGGVEPQSGYHVYYSPDGLRWRWDAARGRLFPQAQCKHGGGYSITQNGIGDTSIVVFDPALDRYVFHTKFVLPGTFRCFGQSLSEDLTHWTPPRMTVFPDERDDPDSQIYSHIPFNYEDMWIGMVRVMHMQRTGWKQTDVELSHSRDGLHWHRPTQREAFIPLGAPDSWEPDYTEPATSAPLLVGDELWFYYRGTRNPERGGGSKIWESSLGLATLRRDGFASLDADDEPGLLLTRPLNYPRGKHRLHINAEIGAGGWIKAAVLTDAGVPEANRVAPQVVNDRPLPPALPDYELADAEPCTVSSVSTPLHWRDAQTLPALEAHEHVRLLFEMRNARLYAFWVDEESA